MYSHIIHLGDIHIRCGDEASARFQEYETVFANLLQTLKDLPCVQHQTAMVALCGDIFHNKYRLEAYSVLLWTTLIQSLTELAPVVVICGNHDYRQEAPETPDLIDVMMRQFKPTHFPCHYLKDTGVYSFENINFGLVSIKDTLNALNTHGTVENLPLFPEPSPNHLNVALFHGTIIQSSLPNGQYMAADKGYALEWFKGYDMVLLGDNHKQQTHKSPYGFHWGYPGSLVQQDIGEPVLGHGFLLWDLITKKPTIHHIYNPYGRMKARFCNGTFAVKLVPNEPMVQLDTVRHESWFPTRPHFLMLGAIGDEWRIQDYLKSQHITPSSVRSTSTSQLGSGGTLNADGTEPSLASSLDTIHQLNNPRMWLDYILTKDAEAGKQLEQYQWIESPNQMLMPPVPKSLSKELHEMTVKYRGKLEQMIDTYHKTTETLRQQRHRVVLKHMSWDWVYSYGLKNWFHFENIQNKVGLLCGKNATGKSAFIDALCIGLFGEPSLNRQLNSSKKMNEHCIHSNRPKGSQIPAMNVKIMMTVDGDLYEIERHYQQSVVDMESRSISMDLYRIDKTTNEKIQIRSGTVMVNEWVEQHIGRMEDLLKTSIVSQMDNHNFFFAKPDEQKAMIDSAVNLKELQAFGEVVHEALLNYQALSKTLSTILQANEERTPTVSPEERKEAQQRWNRLEDRRKALDERKDTLLGTLGALGGTKHQMPDHPRAYWESRRAPSADWATRLAELRAMHAECLYEQKAHAYDPDTAYSTETDYEAETARVERKLVKHRSKKPPSARPLAFLRTEQARLDEWFERHQDWIDTMDDHASRLTAIRAERDALEDRYADWMKQTPSALPSGVPGSAKAKPAKPTNSAQPEDWKSLVQTYHTLLNHYQEHQALDASHPKAKWATWCAEKAEYDQWVEDAEANDWTDKTHLEKNLRDTQTYIHHRQQLALETERLAQQMREQKETLQSHGDWKAIYEQAKSDRATLPEGETLESIESQIAALQRLESIQNDPWWKDYAAWKKKQERCIKHGWLSVATVEAELAEYEADRRRFKGNAREHERFQKERADFLQSNPHPECAVCQTRMADLTARMAECTEAMEEWTLEKLDAFIQYYQKALAAIQYVETLQASMETTYARYENEKTGLKEVVHYRMPDLEARRACHRRVQEGTTYQWLYDLDIKYQQTKKQWKKSSQRLAAMQTEEDLRETEAYWKHALDVCSKIAYKQPFMARETAAWEAAKKAWEAHPEVPAETLASAWTTAESAWRSAGDDLKAERETMQATVRALEDFEETLAEHTEQRTRLETEMEWATAAADWEARTAELETRLADLQASRWALQMHRCLDERAHYEAFEEAEKWILWYDLGDLQAELDAVQTEQKHLQASAAMQACDDEGSGAGAEGTRASPYMTLKQYAEDWDARVKVLAVMDKYLIGEKGKKKKDAEDIDTFKEWIYQHHALPMLEERVNEFLQSIDVDLTLRMVYGKRAMKYMVRDRGNETSFAASSGFQQFVIGLGMRHALSHIGGIGNNLQHLFIDEGFTACDLDNVEKAYDILELLIKRGHYQSILMISHLESIQQRVPLKIPLERKDTFTKLAYGEPYPVFANSVKRRGRPPKKQG